MGTAVFFLDCSVSWIFYFPCSCEFINLSLNYANFLKTIKEIENMPFGFLLQVFVQTGRVSPSLKHDITPWL